VDTLYYRKISEIAIRDASSNEVCSAANRVLTLPRTSKSHPTKSDRRILKAWMYAWIDSRRVVVK